VLASTTTTSETVKVLVLVLDRTTVLVLVLLPQTTTRLQSETQRQSRQSRHNSHTPPLYYPQLSVTAAACAAGALRDPCVDTSRSPCHHASLNPINSQVPLGPIHILQYISDQSVVRDLMLMRALFVQLLL
jgi:hypothetical protein